MERRYPVGLQTFSEIIRGGYVYVDKTDLVWELAHYAKFIFLSRPRRFGKSLLTSTLDSYFRGEKELFQGLKIMDLEKEWQCYPVLHFDLSGTKHLGHRIVKDELGILLKQMEAFYGADSDETTPGMRLGGLIRRAMEKTGKQVVVVIDEYDAPLLDILHEDEELSLMREVMQEFYQRLKMYESKIKFCFITGITKFSQLSIFSTINNLTNVTLDPTFANICGFTEHELTTVLGIDISRLADVFKVSYEEVQQKLRLKYDGYHFTEDSDGIYNPFSMLKAFQQRKLNNFWFESGTPSFLIKQMQRLGTDITSLERMVVSATAFDQPTEDMTDALPLLYQSGYLTIKDYNQETQMYTLSIPNQEVRIGYVEGLLPTYVGLKASDVQAGFALRFWQALKKDDVDLALREMRAYLAGIPYVEGFKKKLEDASTSEGFYEYTMYLIFSMLNVYVWTQVKCNGGQADMVVHMPNTTYVLELKINGTAQQALDQINSHGYAFPYQTESKNVVKVGIRFSTESKNIEDWIVE